MQKPRKTAPRAVQKQLGQAWHPNARLPVQALAGCTHGGPETQVLPEPELQDSVHH